MSLTNNLQDSVLDLQNTLHDVLTHPRLMTHVTKTHQANVHSIYETAESSSRRKRRKLTVSEPSIEHADVTALALSMDSIRLKSWPLTLHSASFIRPPKHSDRNTLIHAKEFSMANGMQESREALIFITIYNKLSWGHRQLFRSSQHVLLSSQTLSDLIAVIPCPSTEIPKEIADESIEDPEYGVNISACSSDCVVCIDGLLYGGIKDVQDYSEGILKLCTMQNDGDDHQQLKRGTSIHETTFASLSVHLHKPYWFLHAGNCEHYFVVDQIRSSKDAISINDSADTPAPRSLSCMFQGSRGVCDPRGYQIGGKPLRNLCPLLEMDGYAN
ncbi:uncharacterized protein FIBRA_03540 [Fibroporia radiculosa]|uniref:snRNA-activating protein complex subunit 3 n=1 Tax=Fibroporia radiculosa TaxID=599839 RepID=J4I9N8_9APHY|nr:uncharacterized protein FIBRA_03540 [Fibroporia radiculosa]CCM01486.1 predicted protein [Fibroporia radiculosa]